MTIDRLRRYCAQKGGALESYPFDQVTLVFKVERRMFALLNETSSPPRVNLKCDPSLARDLRAAFSAILPGYHMNKEHWNTVLLDGSVPDGQVEWLIDHSYDLVAHRPKGRRRGRGAPPPERSPER
ncbi:MAG TPA: MmcQ/YjbR family DNA-binding protein [Spirochaetia bacterium]|nr:MmcQ/YjbR family DNA-binding protein [Spirochaetia bacterium]